MARMWAVLIVTIVCGAHQPLLFASLPQAAPPPIPVHLLAGPHYPSEVIGVCSLRGGAEEGSDHDRDDGAAGSDHDRDDGAAGSDHDRDDGATPVPEPAFPDFTVELQKLSRCGTAFCSHIFACCSQWHSRLLGGIGD